MRAKRQADKPNRQPVQRKEKRAQIIEVDLHIHELLDSTAGLSNSDMLEVQLNEFRRVMNENLRNKGQKIVFIHGKGEGVLRNALLKELNYKYKQCSVQDASFREYGFGATQVTIH
jgi:dsDNA-specific endonuclease/ATPase MutS2